MRVGQTFSLALAGLTGCSGPCAHEPIPFSVDEELTEERVLDLIEVYRVDRVALDCEVVCDAMREYDGDITEYSFCELDVSEPLGDDSAEIVGHITCRGSDTRSCA